MKVNKLSKLRRVYKLVPYSCLVGLVVLGLMIINPACDAVNGEVAYAAETVTQGSSISLTLDGWQADGTSLPDMNATVPITDVKTAYLSQNVNVDITNVRSYAIQVTGSNLVHKDDGTTIAGAGGKRGSELEENTWGFGWGETNTAAEELVYYTVPASATAGGGMAGGIVESANTSTGSVSLARKLVVAANFGDDVPEGTYHTDMMLSLVVDPTENTTGLGFAGYTTMQEMDKTKCSAIANGTKGRLRDTRDNKVYWVGKLKDGLCWMTQNLDYDGPGTQVTNMNSTSNAQWTDPGNLIHTDGAWNTPAWFTNMQDASLAQSSREAELLHYHIGNYYNWTAATNSSTVTNGNVSTSVCPAGWSLPLSGSNNNGADGSFYKLLNGLAASTIVEDPYYYTYNGYKNGTTVNSRGSAGYYWSGTIWMNGGLVRTNTAPVGTLAAYMNPGAMVAVVGNTTYSRFLSFTATSVNPSDEWPAPTRGNAVRCVVR